MRFPGFTEEWEKKRLEELLKFKVTNSFSRENLNYEVGTVKNIHYGDIHTKFQILFDITKEVVPFINKDLNLGRISDENYCKAGDIIFADASEDLDDVGKSIEIINVNGEKLLSGLHTLLARPKVNIFHLGFNGYLFKSNQVRTQIQKESQGTKVLSINVGRISKIELSFPSLREQEKITAFLSLLDERIETQNKIIEELRLLKNEISKKIFLRQLIFKDDDGNHFPEWENMKLGDIGEVKMCRRVFNDETSSTGEIPFFKIGSFGKEADAFISKKLYADYRKRFPFPKKGDVLISAAGTIGRTVIYKGEDAYFQDSNIVWIDNNNTKVTNEYLYYILQIVKYNTEGGTIQRLYNNILKSTTFNCPSLIEQTKIANFLLNIDKKIKIEIEIFELQKSQKQYLLRQMFI